MNVRKVSGFIFLAVGLLHFYRAAVEGSFEVLDYELPVQASWWIAGACAILAYLNFRRA